MFPAASVKMEMPVFIRDYTDFYSSYSHAYNVGCMIRGPDNAIQPNWLHLPVGYHGRASSIVVSGTPVRRPKGQVSADKVNPSWSRCNRMDLELEMGTFIGKANNMGDPIPVNEARDHILALFCSTIGVPETCKYGSTYPSVHSMLRTSQALSLRGLLHPRPSHPSRYL